MDANLRGAFKRRELKRKGAYVYSKRAGKARIMAKPYTGIRFPRYFGDQPHTKNAILRYTTIFTQAGLNANTIVTYEFRSNGMFRPDAAIATQPVGFSRIMEQYYHFTVLKSKCTIEHMNMADSSNQIWQIMAYNDTATPNAAFTIAPGNNYQKLYSLPSKSMTVGATGFDHRGSTRSVSLWSDMVKNSGKNAKDLIGEKEFSGDGTADPVEQSFFGVVGSVPSGVASAVNATFKVTVTYFAVFSEPRVIGF